MDRIKDFLGDDWKIFSDGIVKRLESEIGLLNSINQNLLSNSGKQVRPVLALLAARLCAGEANEDSIRYAISAELLHNATLMHDDVADDSDERRGKPTLKSLMGPCVAVLVGDYWMASSLTSIMEGRTGRDEVLTQFSATLADLARGEMLQLQKAEHCDTRMEDYMQIIYCKTASLFVCSMKAAAYSVSATPAQLEAVESFARNLGYAFQMKDDILDYAGTSAVGKPLGVDIMEGKITLPLLGAMYNAGEQKALALREEIRNVNEAVRDKVMAFVKEHGGVEYAQTVLEEYLARAVEALDIFPDTPERRKLVELAHYMAVRNK